MLTRGLLNATFLQLTSTHAWKIMEKDASLKRLQMCVATQFFYGLWKEKANF